MAKDIGIDLGTANVLIYVQGKGVVLNEPSVVAVDTNNGKILAVGSEAYRMVGRTPSNIRAMRPLKDGVISDFDITQSGGGKVYLEYEPKVAAIGAGLDIFKPSGNMVIDMGGGTSDIAILSLGDIVSSQSVRMAGDKMNTDITEYIKAKHGLVIGEHSAEQIKIKLGTALKVAEPKTMDVRGRDVATGMPRQIQINENEIEEALHDTLGQIVHAAIAVLETVPPELASDIIDRGVMLTGGTALLHGIDQLFSEKLKVPVVVSQDPLDNVAKGAGELLERMQANPANNGKRKRKRK